MPSQRRGSYRHTYHSLYTGGGEGEQRKPRYGDAVGFLLEQIKAHPGEITLIALGPLTNIGAAIDRDLNTFRKLKRGVLMGGAIYRGYDKAGSSTPQAPEPEYNIARDPKSAQKLSRCLAFWYSCFQLDSTLD